MTNRLSSFSPAHPAHAGTCALPSSPPTCARRDVRFTQLTRTSLRTPGRALYPAHAPSPCFFSPAQPTDCRSNRLPWTCVSHYPTPWLTTRLILPSSPSPFATGHVTRPDTPSAAPPAAGCFA